MHRGQVTPRRPGLEWPKPLSLREGWRNCIGHVRRIDRVAQAVTDVVILVEGDDSRLQRGDLHLVQVDGVADNDLVVGLAGAGGRSIQDAASAAFPIPMTSCGQLMQSPAS